MRPTLSFATRDFVAKLVVEYTPFPPPLHVDVATFSLWYVFIFNSYTIFLNSVFSVKTPKYSDDRKLFQPHLSLDWGNRTVTPPKVMFGVAQPTKDHAMKHTLST